MVGGLGAPTYGISYSDAPAEHGVPGLAVIDGIECAADSPFQRLEAGGLIPNAWIMGMDYLGINYDYQDNVYLVSNMKPTDRCVDVVLLFHGSPLIDSVNH